LINYVFDYNKETTNILFCYIKKQEIT